MPSPAVPVLTATTAAAAAIAPAKAAKELHEAAPRAHVYLMRGLMNIFSLGMDQLAATIAQVTASTRASTITLKLTRL